MWPSPPPAPKEGSGDYQEITLCRRVCHCCTGEALLLLLLPLCACYCRCRVCYCHSLLLLPFRLPKSCTHCCCRRRLHAGAGAAQRRRVPVRLQPHCGWPVPPGAHWPTLQLAAREGHPLHRPGPRPARALCVMPPAWPIRPPGQEGREAEVRGRRPGGAWHYAGEGEAGG